MCSCVAHLLHNCVMKSDITLKMLISSSQKSNLMQLEIKPDKPNSLLLVVRLSLLLQDKEAG